jgi:hypothetical protein
VLEVPRGALLGSTCCNSGVLDAWLQISDWLPDMLPLFKSEAECNMGLLQLPCNVLLAAKQRLAS